MSLASGFVVTPGPLYVHLNVQELMVRIAFYTMLNTCIKEQPAISLPHHSKVNTVYLLRLGVLSCTLMYLLLGEPGITLSHFIDG